MKVCYFSIDYGGGFEMQKDKECLSITDTSNGIYTGFLSVGRYPALIWQSQMNAMCWLESRIVHGKVIIHPN